MRLKFKRVLQGMGATLELPLAEYGQVDRIIEMGGARWNAQEKTLKLTDSTWHAQIAKAKREHYSSTDFDVLVLHLRDKKDMSYRGSFVVPMQVLVEREIVSRAAGPSNTRIAVKDLGDAAWIFSKRSEWLQPFYLFPDAPATMLHEILLGSRGQTRARKKN